MTGPVRQALKDRVRQREPLLGIVLTLPTPEVAEICAAAGFDWLFIDMEHGLLDFAAVQRLIQAAGSCPCVVRTPMNEPVWIGRALDTGAAGIIVPHVSTAAEARRFIRAGKYPPEGDRSIGVARAQLFGARVQESVDSDNDRVLLIPQAEHIDAARNIGEILAVAGLDAVFIGPFDLSASLGKPGQIADADVQSAVGTIRDRCRQAGIACGIFVVDAESARRAIGEGYSLVCVSTDTTLLTGAARQIVTRSKE